MLSPPPPLHTCVTMPLKVTSAPMQSAEMSRSLRRAALLRGFTSTSYLRLVGAGGGRGRGRVSRCAMGQWWSGKACKLQLSSSAMQSTHLPSIYGRADRQLPGHGLPVYIAAH